jgi:hypothetical protein
LYHTIRTGPYSEKEEEDYIRGIKALGKQWEKIAEQYVKTRDGGQLMNKYHKNKARYDPYLNLETKSTDAGYLEEAAETTRIDESASQQEELTNNNVKKERHSLAFPSNVTAPRSKRPTPDCPAYEINHKLKHKNQALERKVQLERQYIH